MSRDQAGEPLYLMHAVTAPLDPRVRDRIAPLLEESPSLATGLLRHPGTIRRVVDAAREEAASAWACSAEEILFTSGGAEASNLALKGVALARLAKGERTGRVIVGATEMASVLHPARTLARFGFDLQEAPVDAEGVILIDELERLLDRPALIVSIASMNAETGVLQPMKEILHLAHSRGALLHADASVAAARLPASAALADADLVSISGHRLGAPRGSGALVVRRSVRLAPLIEGGPEEGGRRAGSHFVAGVAGLAAAAGMLASDGPARQARLEEISERLTGALLQVPGVVLNGPRRGRGPGIVNVSVPGIDGEALRTKLERRGILVSSGSPCFDGIGKPSHVLIAMGLPAERARSSLLFSPGHDLADAAIGRVAQAFAEAVASLRAVAGL